MICNKCNIDKPQSDFYFRKDNNKFRNQCKECIKLNVTNNYFNNHEKIKNNKRAKYKKVTRYDNYYKKYGITKERLDELINKQDGKCWICEEELWDRLNVDHCHENGEFRGIICKNCNMGIGLFKDSLINLNKAIEYLKLNGEQYAT